MQTDLAAGVREDASDPDLPTAVQLRAELRARQQRWLRRLWSPRTGPRSGTGMGAREEPAERAYRAREARAVDHLFEAGLHHLR